MLIAQLLAAFGLIVLCTVFVTKLSEHFLRSRCGDALFEASCYYRDLSLYAGYTAFVSSVLFAGYTLKASQITNLVILCAVLAAGYYVTFRGILLTLFSSRFRQILRTRYGVIENVAFEGASARYHAGGIPSYVGSHLQRQMDTSNKVALPIGIVWVVFILLGLVYLPEFWIEGLIMSGSVGLYCAIFSTVTLLPSGDEDKVVSTWRASPCANFVPPSIFMTIFALLTPFCCQLSATYLTPVL